jgi:hypothetical protein
VRLGGADLGQLGSEEDASDALERVGVSGGEELVMIAFSPATFPSAK